MDSLSAEIVTFVLCDQLSSLSHGGLLCTVTTCRLVCKLWKGCVEAWPRYKHIKPLFDRIRQARDKKRMTIKHLSEMGDPLVPELCFNFLKKMKRIDSRCVLDFSGLHKDLVYKCLSLCIGVTSAVMFCVTSTSLQFLQHCTRLRNLYIQDALELENVDGLEGCKLLKKVTLVRCPKLVSLSAMNTSKLETLYISYSNTTGDITFLLKARHLQECAILNTKVSGQQMRDVCRHICNLKKGKK